MLRRPDEPYALELLLAIAGSSVLTGLFLLAAAVPRRGLRSGLRLRRGARIGGSPKSGTGVVWSRFARVLLFGVVMMEEVVDGCSQCGGV
jgi:hypothetical protein